MGAMRDLLAERRSSGVARAVRRLFPNGLTDDYTRIVSDRHLDRLRGLVEEARDRGARVVQLAPVPEGANGRIMPPTLVIDPGNFSELDGLRDLTAVVITHQHKEGYRLGPEARDVLDDGPSVIQVRNPPPKNPALQPP